MDVIASALPALSLLCGVVVGAWIAHRERLLALSRADKTIPELSVDEILAQAEQEGK